jgi:hypothetical protein
MGVPRLSMIVLSMDTIVICVGMLTLACKFLCFSGLAFFHLRLLPRGRVLRIVYCVAFRCVIQVISLSGAGRCC